MAKIVFRNCVAALAGAGCALLALAGSAAWFDALPMIPDAGLRCLVQGQPSAVVAAVVLGPGLAGALAVTILRRRPRTLGAAAEDWIARG